MDIKKAVPTAAKKPVVKPVAKKTPVKKMSEAQRIKNLLSLNSSTRIDLGCGENKMPGAIGVDFRKVNGVDIVQNLSLYPWSNIPDKCADVVITSHLLEHINPASSNPQLTELIKLLVAKKIITDKEVDSTIGDHEFLGGFIRFCDEVWRITKPGGQFISTFPYAGSPGYWQDPTHVNPISHVTMAYMDPLAKDQAGNLYHLYSIYRPKPWKILRYFYDQSGFAEIAMERREIDKSYNCSSENGMSK